MEFVIARNPDGASSLPYLVRLPLGRDGIALKVRDTWPRTAKVYCHRADDWPDELDIVERVPVRSCVRRGAVIDLVLDRGRENRSQFVFAMARGREVIFWQSARTAKQARPAVSVPTARTFGQVLEILVDSHERYPWTFNQQQASTSRRALPAGDYAVAVDDSIVATVERKSLPDLVSTLTSGKLRYLLAELAAMPRAALVVEDRWSSVFKLDRVRPSVVADGLAEAQVRYPTVPIVFCETRPLAQEWAYRFLGAAVAHRSLHQSAAELERRLPSAGPVAPAEPTLAEVRAWAKGAGLEVAARGKLRPEIWAAFRGRAAQADRPASGSALQGYGDVVPGTPDTVAEAMRQLVELGYDAEFDVVSHAHQRAACRGDDGRLRLVVRRRYRFEGPSDPGDEAVVVGVVCEVCGAKGIVVSAFGPDADDELIELAHFLTEDHDHGDAGP